MVAMTGGIARPTASATPARTATGARADASTTMSASVAGNAAALARSDGVWPTRSMMRPWSGWPTASPTAMNAVTIPAAV